MIIALFLTALFRLEVGLIVVLIFVGCMSSLIVSLIYFIADINLSLSALRFEIASHDGPSDQKLNKSCQM